jgi:hypothetical protein
MRTTAFVVVVFGLTLATAPAGDNDPQAVARKELSPRAVTFSKPTLPLPQALAELTAGTGNAVGDRRRDKADPPVALPTGPTTFWPALDAISRASGIGHSPYVSDGGVTLTDMPYRALPTAYAGLFRVAVRRVAVSRDEETGSRHCQLALDVAWEPRFRPFYVDLKQTTLAFAPDRNQKALKDVVPGRGPVPVTGRTAIELEVLGAAPDRSCPKLDAMDGTIWAVGPSKMLAFRFDKLALGKPNLLATQEGVTVRIVSIIRTGAALLVRVQVENPKGGPRFDTYQETAWVENNRIVLATGAGAKKRSLSPTGTGDERVTAQRADITYEFTDSGGQRLPASLEGWALHYETPGRIVELTAPFTLKDLPLP